MKIVYSCLCGRGNSGKSAELLRVDESENTEE